MLIGCGQATGPDEVLPRLELTAQQLQLAESADRFGLKLFREIVRQEPDKNIFISPLSISMALGMTANGAAGTTLDSMRATLELTGLTEEESNAAYQSLMALLTQADPQVQMEIANSLWPRQGWTFEEDFIQRCEDYFAADIRSLDFADPASVDVINAWIEENTNGLIREMLDTIPAEAVLYLINALYFKGTWTYEFDPAETVDDQFNLLDGSQASIRMMRQEADLLYLANEQFQAVDLPYGDGLFSMTVLLPQPGISVDSIISELTPENWSTWIGSLDTTAIHLQMPKFKLGYKVEMNDILSNMGMAVAFSRAEADFTRMIPRERLGGENLFISRVLHQTFVQVDEEGTEAAAATIVEIGFTSMPSTISFRVDRPFIFVIRERSSGAMLFMGKIVEPLWEE